MCNFDLITKLGNYPHILEMIFSYLMPKELRSVICVSKDWMNIIKNITKKANNRRLLAIRKLKKMKKIKGKVCLCLLLLLLLSD